MIIGINGQNLQNANATQTYQPGITITVSAVTNATAFKIVNPSQSTDKVFEDKYKPLSIQILMKYD